MSSYSGQVGAWDGGPPGAEADYAPQPPTAPLPTTDPWTGVSYSQYGQPQYDYQAYGASSYGYSYDSTYYQRPDGGYYDTSTNAYPLPQAENYDYTRPQEGSRSPHESRSHHGSRSAQESRSPHGSRSPRGSRSPHRSRDYQRRRSSYRSNSRSVSPYDRQRDYSKKRESSYEDNRWHRSRSASKTKYNKYTSSDRSSYKSRSYSRSPKKIKKERRSSSESSGSVRSYKKSSVSRNERSLTPPLKNRMSHSQNRLRSNNEARSPSSKYKREKTSRSKDKVPYYESKLRDRRERDVFTPPRKNVSDSQKSRKRTEKSITPPVVYKRTERSPQRKRNYRDQKSDTSQKKTRDSSVTPPRCYARSGSSSRSRSRSLTPKTKHKHSCVQKLRRSRSLSSSHSSASSTSTRKRSKRRDKRKSMSKRESRSKSRSRRRSVSKTISNSGRRSTSRFKARRSRSPKSKSRSRSRSSRLRSRSRSGTPSDEECRGQFTVADRKLFWKLHKSRQEQAEKCKSPPKEVRPPPGAVETSNAVDVEYGDPPEVEGPNFAELLVPPEHAPSSSKSKQIPMPIKNDGSFLEMFKKMQEATKKVEQTVKKPEIKKPILPFIGKRRGGRVLKTGLVKKAKAIDEQTVDNTPKDAWSLYMQEVKKYRETSCEEERKTRPLVK